MYEEVHIDGKALRNAHPLVDPALGILETFTLSGSQIDASKPTERRLHERDQVAKQLSRWLVGTFAISVGAVVLVGLFLLVWVTVAGNAKDMDTVVGTLTKWATTLGTLLAAPLGFVLGHYFKSGT
jgi:hypothetical protein